MNRLPGFRIDTERTPGIDQQGRWRFVLLILAFNILLIATLLLSMRQRELVQERQYVFETRTVIEELVFTQEMIEPVTITIVVTPGSTLQTTPTEP